ncbi:MAG: hypothetical protein KC466_09870 [Myxococcales bacterium]|nr:hypothetical protein [Myxococcales bacterium]
MKHKSRPTWKLGDETHPATYPAVDLDPDQALQAALEATVGYDRYNDVSLVLGAAIDHAAECMKDAISEIAFRARDLGPDTPQVSESGWRAFWEPGPSGTNIDLMLVHETEPGAWHLSVRFNPVMTEAAEAREAEIEARIAEANTGVSPRDLFMARLFPKKDDPLMAELKRLEDDPASYRPAARGDRLTVVYGTALDLGAKGWRGTGPGGKPAHVEEFAHARHFLPLKAYQDTWWNGLQLTLRPNPSYQRHEGMLTHSNDRGGACPEIPLRILSDLIRASDLAPQVAKRAAEVGSLPWISYGAEHRVPLEEAGHAMVHAAGGVFDASVSRRLTAFWAGIAAQDVERHLADWFALAPELAAAGHGTGDGAFSCNDGRDLARAELNGPVRSLRTKTQNGIYRVEMTEDGEGGVARVLALREVGGRDLPIGRFLMTEEGLRPDFGPGNGPEVAYQIRTVRDLNGAIGSLASVACVFEEERTEARAGSDDPEP